MNAWWAGRVPQQEPLGAAAEGRQPGHHTLTFVPTGWCGASAAVWRFAQNDARLSVLRKAGLASQIFAVGRSVVGRDDVAQSVVR